MVINDFTNGHELGYHVIYRSHVDAQYLMAMDMGQDFTTK
jgi:hypothetical protein